MINIIGLVIVFTSVCLLTMCESVGNQEFNRGGLVRLNTTAYRGCAMLIIMLAHITGEWGGKYLPLSEALVLLFSFSCQVLVLVNHLRRMDLMVFGKRSWFVW